MDTLLEQNKDTNDSEDKSLIWEMLQTKMNLTKTQSFNKSLIDLDQIENYIQNLCNSEKEEQLIKMRNTLKCTDKFRDDQEQDIKMQDIEWIQNILDGIDDLEQKY